MSQNNQSYYNTLFDQLRTCARYLLVVERISHARLFHITIVLLFSPLFVDKNEVFT